MEELFNLVDIDGSGIMEWSEFETFVANEIQEGRDFMEGEFVLPSGAGIQFAAMVDVLRRKSRVQAVMKVLSATACLQHVHAVLLLACVLMTLACGNALCVKRICNSIQLVRRSSQCPIFSMFGCMVNSSLTLREEHT